MALEDLKKQIQYTGILLEPYLDWCEAEGLPVIEDFCVDLHTVPTAHWARAGVEASFVHLKGRGDFVSVFLFDLAPGAKTVPQGHLYEEVFLVVSGHGSTTIEMANGEKRSFEWGPNSLFAIPLNARYQIFNGSGSERARLASTNNLCLIMNLIHDEDFIFANGWKFPLREGADASWFEGGGVQSTVHRGLRMWETNFVADVAGFEVKSWNQRGAGSAHVQFCLADGNLHAHCSEMGVGTYKKGHRHGPDFHVFIVSGHGYSLFWHDGDDALRRFDWKQGSVFAPTDMIWHQHFNTAAVPARYLATAMGSTRYPFTEEKRAIKRGVDVDVNKGGNQIEYENQDPRIHRMFLAELETNGVACAMGRYLDEAKIPR
jgi:mannose-6-phosphate isomerase-like protein (cupin superfamily)